MNQSQKNDVERFNTKKGGGINLLHWCRNSQEGRNSWCYSLSLTSIFVINYCILWHSVPMPASRITTVGRSVWWCALTWVATTPIQPTAESQTNSSYCAIRLSPHWSKWRSVSLHLWYILLRCPLLHGWWWRRWATTLPADAFWGVTGAGLT